MSKIDNSLLVENEFYGTIVFETQSLIKFSGWIKINNIKKQYDNKIFIFNTEILGSTSQKYFYQYVIKEMFKNKYTLQSHKQEGICLNWSGKL